MRVVLQRVTHSSVSIDGKMVGEISVGYTLLFGVYLDDKEKDAKEMAKKIVNLRVMNDEAQSFDELRTRKMNKSILEADGEILVISQFSLYADTSGGRRPSFIKAAKPEISQSLYELFIEELKNLGVKKVATGEFGAYMDVEIDNDGPVTILLDSRE